MQVISTHILGHIVITMRDQNQIDSFTKIIFLFSSKQVDVADNSAKIAINDNDIDENSAQITINTANITKIANDLADYCKYLLSKRILFKKKLLLKRSM